jgi:dihydrofolate reductase
MPVSLIAAVAENGVIGRDGKLPWHLPEDLRRFKRLTQGHHLIVGRATWESVGKPLPGRTFIVVTSRGAESGLGPGAARSVAEAIRWAQESGDEEPFVAGGARIYREALERDLVDRLHLTRIHRSYEGDTRFPDFDVSGWRVVESESHPADAAANRPGFDFLVYERARQRA